MRRRGLLGLLLAPLAIRGTGDGGTPPVPAGYVPPSLPGQAAGSVSQIIRARQVIIIGPNGELLVYNPVVASGDLVASIAGVAGTGLAGDTVYQGIASYNGALVAQLNAGGLALQAAAGQIAGNFAGVVSAGAQAGQVIITSGGNSAVDPQAEIVLDSAAVAGTPTAVIVGNLTVQNNLTVIGTASINGSTNTGNGSNGGVTSGPSGTVNAFPAAGPNHTHAEVHQHPI